MADDQVAGKKAVVDDIRKVTERIVNYSSRLKSFGKSDPEVVDQVAASLSELAADLRDCAERLATES